MSIVLKNEDGKGKNGLNINLNMYIRVINQKDNENLISELVTGGANAYKNEQLKDEKYDEEAQLERSFHEQKKSITYLDNVTGEIIENDKAADGSLHETFGSLITKLNPNVTEKFTQAVLTKQIGSFDFELNLGYVYKYMAQRKSLFKPVSSSIMDDSALGSYDNYYKYDNIKNDQLPQDLLEPPNLAGFDVKSVEPIVITATHHFSVLMLVLSKKNEEVYFDQPYSLKIWRRTEAAYEQRVKAALNDSNFLRRLIHPNIATAYESGTNMYFNDSQYISFVLMEYLPFGNLREFLKFDFLDLEMSKKFRLVKCFSAQILMALQYIHGFDIIHCDLSPFIIAIGVGFNLKIFDFSFAIMKENVSEYPRISNVTVYTSYERAEALRKYREHNIEIPSGAYNELTDIYSFSVILYEMVYSLKLGGYKRPNMPAKQIFITSNRQRFDRVIADFRKQSESQDAHPYLTETYKLFESAYHPYDWLNRSLAGQLLQSEYYFDVNLPKLFTQQGQYIMKELNIDLSHLFASTHQQYIEKAKTYTQDNYFYIDYTSKRS